MNGKLADTVSGEMAGAGRAPLLARYAPGPIGIDLKASRRWRIHLGARGTELRRIDLDAIPQPAWAESIERDGETLFATLSEGKVNRKVRWVPRRDFEVIAPAQGQPRYELPHGAWWDDAEYTAFVGAEGQLRCPGWANAGHGTDEFGYWAAFSVGGVTQTMRFVPPGRFTMGSPDDVGAGANPQLFAVEAAFLPGTGRRRRVEALRRAVPRAGRC